MSTSGGCDPCCGIIPVKKGLKICSVVRVVTSLLCAAVPAYILYALLVQKDYKIVQTQIELNASPVIAGVVLLIELLNVVMSVVLFVFADKSPAKRLFIPSGVRSVLNLIYVILLFLGYFVARGATFILSISFLLSALMTCYTAMLVRAVVRLEKMAKAAEAGPQQTWNVVTPSGDAYVYTSPVYGQPSQSQGFMAPLPPQQQLPQIEGAS